MTKEQAGEQREKSAEPATLTSQQLNQVQFNFILLKLGDILSRLFS